jgi:hypothetical protein
MDFIDVVLEVEDDSGVKFGKAKDPPFPRLTFCARSNRLSSLLPFCLFPFFPLVLFEPMESTY